MNLIKISPFTRIVDRWPGIVEFTDTLNNVAVNESFSNFVDFIDKLTEANKLPSQQTVFQQAFLHIVTETVFDYPNVWISEKTIKPIINKRPFILVSSAGCLQNLREIGFKTFSEFWNEEYDSIVDPNCRMREIFKIINQICALSIHEIQDMCTRMEDILEYNFNFYYTKFKNEELKKFEKQCIINLEVR